MLKASARRLQLNVSDGVPSSSKGSRAALGRDMEKAIVGDVLEKRGFTMLTLDINVQAGFQKKMLDFATGNRSGGVVVTMVLRFSEALDPAVFPNQIRMQEYVLVPKVGTESLSLEEPAKRPDEKPSFRFYSLSAVAQSVIRKNMCLPAKRMRPAQTSLYCVDPTAAWLKPYP